MKMIKIGLLQFWHQLNNRERYLLIFGVGCLALYLAYTMYTSLAEAVVVNTQSLAEKKETLAWIKQAEKQFSFKQKNLATRGKVKGLAVLSEKLKTASFHAFAYQLQQLSEDELQLSFEKVPYNGFLTWFSSMSQTYNITIKELQVDRTDVQGLVKLTVILSLNA